jgi:uncharacterized repeat protein (TIGR02059 family)
MKLKFKSLIVSVRERYIHHSFLFLLLSITLLPIHSNAQETSINVGSATRKMIVYAPSGIKQNSPLIITMHGMNQTMTDQKNQTSFQSVADANGFILVYPQSIGTMWDLNGTSDIDFILAIINEMYKRYSIDRDRVYLSGFSMGGMMCYYAATKIADKIAAIAPVSGFLMSGPNAVSSRPMPIIHLHGMNDNFVPYSNVQTHIDAWVKRNGCPPAVVTNPFSDPKSIKKYYGPGKEGVEVVFIGVSGVDHWYSNGTGGVVSSQEIWNFCKKYSLKEGVPEFKYASVTDTNPKQIQVVLSTSIVDANPFSGFSVKVDSKSATIENVVLCDTNKLAINLSESILKDNNITLSYSNGNVVSTSLGKKMINFTDKLVDNLLKGSAPQIIEAVTVKNGNSLNVKFNKKMQNPSDVSSLVLNAEYNGSMNIPVLQGSFFSNDSTILSFPLGKQVYRDYKLLLTYSGNNISSGDGGLLNTVSGLPVANNSDGLPVKINSGKIGTDGITLSLEFSKPMTLTSVQSGYFTLFVNGNVVPSKDYSVSGSTIQLILSKCVHYGDTVTISYTPKGVTAADKGPLEGFSDFAVANQVKIPVWIAMPGKIEAENFAFKSGMQTETTGDVGGGLNLGYIGDGNWLEYTIENKTAESSYQISFRLAAPGTGGIIDFYIDDKYSGRVNAPNTGNWQVYQSVTKDITISQGKHYLKLVATKAGFNLNYLAIQDIRTGIDTELSGAKTVIFPNPVSNEMIVSSADFRYNKIEIFDALGNLVLNRTIIWQPVLHEPVQLPDGIYFVKISNESQIQFNKILISNVLN